MKPAEFIAASFLMEHLTTFTLWRPTLTADPYNPEATVATGELENAGNVEGYLDSGFGSITDDHNRMNLATPATIIFPDPATDIRLGDILEAGGRRWRVTSIPANDRNPFTGWQPTLAATVTEVLG